MPAPNPAPGQNQPYAGHWAATHSPSSARTATEAGGGMTAPEIAQYFPTKPAAAAVYNLSHGRAVLAFSVISSSAGPLGRPSTVPVFRRWSWLSAAHSFMGCRCPRDTWLSCDLGPTPDGSARPAIRRSEGAALRPICASCFVPPVQAMCMPVPGESCFVPGLCRAAARRADVSTCSAGEKEDPRSRRRDHAQHRAGARRESPSVGPPQDSAYATLDRCPPGTRQFVWPQPAHGGRHMQFAWTSAYLLYHSSPP